jgi:hypothetical protein
MRNRILLPLMGACFALIVGAQSPPVIATIVVGTDGKSVLTIRNNTTVVLTAFYWSTNNSQGLAGWEFRDAAISQHPNDVVIQPNQQKTFEFTNPRQLTGFAALLADGSSFGDSVFVQRLRDVRLLYQQHLAAVDRIVRPLVASKEPLATIRMALQSAQSTIPNELPPDNRQEIVNIYARTLMDLEDRWPSGQPRPYEQTTKIALDQLDIWLRQAAQYQ